MPPNARIYDNIAATTVCRSNNGNSFHSDDSSIISSSGSNDGNQRVIDGALGHLKKGEAVTIRKVLTAVQNHEQQRMHEGFNELNFSVGVLNSMLVAYVFGNFPEHFWLLWLLEAAALIPRKIWQNWHAKPLREVLYYVDYCWVSC